VYPRLWLSSYNRRWHGGEVGIADALRGAAREIFADHEGPGGVWITDSLFPGYFWLLGRECSTNYRQANLRAQPPLLWRLISASQKRYLSCERTRSISSYGN
jgi:hypothetical protein